MSTGLDRPSAARQALQLVDVVVCAPLLPTWWAPQLCCFPSSTGARAPQLSHMLGPRPPCSLPPSTWYAEVATPHSNGGELDRSALPWSPVTYQKVTMVNYAKDEQRYNCCCYTGHSISVHSSPADVHVLTTLKVCLQRRGHHLGNA